MMIMEFVQGSGQDKQLFGLLGSIITDRAWHKKLGMPILSDPGDVWLVSVGPDGMAEGFALYVLLKSRPAAHIRFLAALEDKPKVQRALLASVLVRVRAAGLKSIHTNDRETNGLWQRHGFVKHGTGRGAFVRWEKTLDQENSMENE